MQIEYMKTDKLVPYVNNPRNNANAVDMVAASIQEFGFKNPIIIDNNNVIVAGHTRLLAAKKIDLETVPVIRADDLTPEQIKAYRLADNKVAEFSTWDLEKLEIELDALGDLEMASFGFEPIGISNDSNEEEADVSVEQSFKYESKYGVIVMCADEGDQERVYNRLTEEGYECKVVAV